MPLHLSAAHENTLDFGDFAVGESRQITFSLTNHGSEPVKFQWPTSLPGLSFSPSTGHLHPSTSKDVSVTFKSDKPVNLRQEHVPGKIGKIKFRDPLNKVCMCVMVEGECYEQTLVQVRDWDDRHKTVHWENVPRSAADSASDKPLPSPAKKKVYHHTIGDFEDMSPSGCGNRDRASELCTGRQKNGPQCVGHCGSHQICLPLTRHQIH